MRRPFLCTLLVCVVAITSCGGSAEQRLSSSSSNSSKISFGVYDISRSSSSPFSIVTNAMRSENAGTAQPTSVQAVDKQSVATPVNSLALATAAAVDTAPSDRKIIRNAELDLEAENPEEVQRNISSVAERNGGFVVESQQSSSDASVNSRDIVMMTVRVPADRFSETLTEIRSAAGRVVTEAVKGVDVTEEFIDIEAQLKAKKALELQFMEIMKRSETVEEALSVQSQLATVRGEIERIEGRKRFLDNQSAMSTIRVRLQTAKVFAAASAGFGTRLSDAFGSGFDVALNFILGLVTFIVAVLPFAVFVGLPAFVIIRYFWNRQTRPRSVVELAEEELKST
jgi:hypothetical protein